MKKFSTLALGLLLTVLFISCKKNNDDSRGEKPVVNPASKFSVLADGKPYDLKVDALNLKMGDTAKLFLAASSANFKVILNAASTTHINGVGDYYLACCTNDVFEFLSDGTRKHWEVDHIGQIKQEGSIKITRMDEKGYAGSFSLKAKDGTSSSAIQKEFSGSFDIIY